MTANFDRLTPLGNSATAAGHLPPGWLRHRVCPAERAADRPPRGQFLALPWIWRWTSRHLQRSTAGLSSPAA